MSTPRMVDEPLTQEMVDALPVYTWDVATIGDVAPPFHYVVTKESIADYCQAVRNPNPLYVDAEAASRGPFGEIVAPPTYIFKCAPLRRNEVMHTRGCASPEEKGLRSTPYAKSEVFFLRPIRVGDEITSVVVLVDKYERRGSQFMTWSTRALDNRGAPVANYTYTIIWQQAPRDPNATETVASSIPGGPPTGERLPKLTKLESQEAIDQYGELARGQQRAGRSLHSDPDFARRTIFAGTVNMGVATAAYCSELLEQAFGPAALLRAGAQLEYKGIRPIRAGYEIEISGSVVKRGMKGVQCELAVNNQQGLLCGVGRATVVPGD